MAFCLKKRLLIDKPEPKELKSPLWVHCASVGEFNTFKPILRELKDRYDILLTYFSPRAKEYLEKNEELYDLLRPLPLDIPFLVKKFERLFRPRALIVVERELWPSLIKATGLKKVLVNAYHGGGFLERMLIREFSLIIARSHEDRIAFEKEGAKDVVVCGNLKFVQEGEPRPPDINIPKGFKILVAGSTREGEEELILSAFKKLKEKMPLKLVIAPRHVKRAGEVEELIKREGFLYTRRSLGTGEWDVLILDTIGELKSFYSIADVAFVGGTFAPVGGHNLLEPAYLGKPVVFGPNTYKVKDIENFLVSKGYGFRAEDVQELSNILEKLLTKGFNPTEDLRAHGEKVKRCYLEHLTAELE